MMMMRRRSRRRSSRGGVQALKWRRTRTGQLLALLSRGLSRAAVSARRAQQHQACRPQLCRQRSRLQQPPPQAWQQQQGRRRPAVPTVLLLLGVS
jgi:hypothetical protein